MERERTLEDMEMKSKHVIIVTGGAGFIGSHLVARLVELGEHVVVVDQKVEKRSYFATQDLRRSVLFERVNVGNRTSIHRLISKYDSMFIFHLAAETIVSTCYENPWRTMETNIMGTVNLLEEVRTNKKIHGMIVASSDKAYGKTKTTYTENSPLSGDHPYDVSKSSADLITLAYAKTYGSPVAVTRFGNVYGEGDIHYDRLIPGISRAIAKKETLIIRSDGTYVRDYVYVEDVVNGYVLLWKKFKEAKGQAFNFSSPDTYSVLQVLDLAEKKLKIPIGYKILNNALNEIPYQHLDDSKIRSFGWKNMYRLGEILPKIVEWYGKHI